MFHQVNDDNYPIYTGTPVETFAKICEFVSKHANVVHLSEIDSLNSTNKKPTVVISFDDGHYDIMKNALPILKKYNLKFNVNIDTEILTTGLAQDNIRVYDVLNQTTKSTYSNPKYFEAPVDIKKDYATELLFSEVLLKLDTKERREFSNHVVEALKNDETVFSKVLSKEDVEHLSQLDVEFGSHTHTHPMLINQSEEDIRAELSHSKKILEELTKKPIKIVAYPNGLANDEIDSISKELDYEYLLYTEDLSNNIETFNKEKVYRINMYHQSFSESLAKIFGVYNKVYSLKKIIS